MSDVITFHPARILAERVPGELAEAFIADSWRGNKYYESIEARDHESLAGVAIGSFMRGAVGYDPTYGGIGYHLSEVPPQEAQRGTGWHDDNLNFMITASPFPTQQAVGETDVATIADVMGEELADKVQAHLDDDRPDWARDALVRAIRHVPDEVVTGLGFAISQFMDWSIVDVGDTVHRGGTNPYEQPVLRGFVFVHHIGITPERATDTSLAAVQASWADLQLIESDG